MQIFNSMEITFHVRASSFPPGRPKYATGINDSFLILSPFSQPKSLGFIFNPIGRAQFIPEQSFAFQWAPAGADFYGWKLLEKKHFPSTKADASFFYFNLSRFSASSPTSGHENPYRITRPSKPSGDTVRKTPRKYLMAVIKHVTFVYTFLWYTFPTFATPNLALCVRRWMANFLSRFQKPEPDWDLARQNTFFLRVIFPLCRWFTLKYSFIPFADSFALRECFLRIVSILNFLQLPHKVFCCSIIFIF